MLRGTRPPTEQAPQGGVRVHQAAPRTCLARFHWWSPLNREGARRPPRSTAAARDLSPDSASRARRATAACRVAGPQSELVALTCAQPTAFAATSRRTAADRRAVHTQGSRTNRG